MDVSKGKCVRLTKGDPREAKVYFEDPLEAARRWVGMGAEMLHLIDLDAAIGSGSNVEEIKRIISAVEVPVEVGGGIRTLEKARFYVDCGAERVILGTAATEMRLVSEALRSLGPRRVMVALDHLAGRVVVNGWKEMTGIDAITLAQRLEGEGVREFMMTSVDRDGTMRGPNLEYSMRAVSSLAGAVYLAGGFRSVKDLLVLRGTRVAGVILGKALYEGAIDLKEAMEAVR